jgi:hypothetical protein
MPVQVQEASRTPKRHNQNKTSPWYIIVKTISTQNKEGMLKTVREKNQITFKGKPIKIIAEIQMTSKYIYKCSTPLAIRKCKLKL